MLASLGGPGANQAAEEFLEECVRLECEAAIDVEIQNELRRLGKEGEKVLEAFWRSEIH